MLNKIFRGVFSKKELHIETGVVLTSIGAAVEDIVRLLHDPSYRTPITFRIGKYELTGGLLSDCVYLDVFDKSISGYDKSRRGRIHVRVGNKILGEKPYRIHCCHAMETKLSGQYDRFAVPHLFLAIDSLIPNVLKEVSELWEQSKTSI